MKYSYTKDLKISPSNYYSNLSAINRIVQKEYSHIENKGINLDSIFLHYSQLAKAAESNVEYSKIILMYLAELKNSHTYANFSRYNILCSAILVEDRLFINYVNEDEFINNGIKAKDEIVEIDGIPALEWLENEKRYISASTEISRQLSAVWNVFRSFYKEDRSYQIKTNDGLKEISIQFEERVLPPRALNPIVQSLTIGDSIGYIAINSMMGNVTKEFLEKYNDVKDLPYLIVDIRNNGGGNSGNSETIAEYLLKNEHRACVSRRLLKPNPNSYQGDIILLISNATFSAAESFALDLLESDEVIVIGSPTGGDTGNRPQGFSTKEGISFRIPTRKPPQVSFNGFPMEGVSIEPHYNVSLSVDDYLNENDTALIFALDLISNWQESKIHPDLNHD